MATKRVISKTVKSNGSGDYTDLITAIDDLLLSGTTAGGDINTYYLYVDDSDYGGNTDLYMPYTGVFYLIGSGTNWTPSGTCDISGHRYHNVYPWVMSNFNIYSENTIPFTLASGSAARFNNVEFYNTMDGPSGIGILEFNNCNAVGSGSSKGCFSSGTYISMNGCNIGRYMSGVAGATVIVTNSRITDCRQCVDATVLTRVSNSLLTTSTATGYGIYSSGTAQVFRSSIISKIPIEGRNLKLYADRCIFSGVSEALDGTFQDGGYVDNSDLLSDTIPFTSSRSVVNNISLQPDFNDPTINDFRLKLDQTDGSPCVEIVPIPSGLSGVAYDVTETNFVLYNSNQNPFNVNDTIPFIYCQDDTTVLTDYEKEIPYATVLSKESPASYIQSFNAIITKTDVPTRASFGRMPGKYGFIDAHPWDWDLKTFYSARIDKDDTYVIPRSYIDMEVAFSGELQSFAGTLLFKTLSKNNFVIYNKKDNRGLSYDYSLAGPGDSAFWLLDSKNHLLSRFNGYTGETIESYPLLCPRTNRNYIRPSGLIYIGVENAKYKYVNPDKPNEYFYGYSENGDFQFLPTDINYQYLLRGILAFKDQLLIVGSRFSRPVTDPDDYPTNGVGIMQLYNDNDIYLTYLGNTSGYYPKEYPLYSGNIHPTDLTAYEDGTIVISDYTNPNILFRYKFAYDYALVQGRYDNEARILLREDYPNVDF